MSIPHNPVPQLPPLDAELCYSNSRIRAFLSLSRSAVDDTIRQHLNETKSINECDEYFQKHIIPQWEIRDRAIRFCSSVSQSLRTEAEKGKAISEMGDQNADGIDLRVDPYALKNVEDQSAKQFEKCDYIDNWVHNEEGIETIVRDQTIEALNNKCQYRDWLGEFRKISSR